MHDYTKQKVKQVIYYGFVGLIVILCLLALFFIIKIGLYPYQHEVREGAPLAITALMLKGINPYSFEVLPAYTYVYGILYPLFTLPLSFIFGIDIVQLRIINIIFCFASFWLILSVVPKKERGLTHYLWAGVLLIGLLHKNIYGRPEALGLFFMLASVIVPYKTQYSKKSLMASIVLAVLGFYTKPYFIIGAGFTAAALFLFISKKTSLIYFTAAMAFWCLSLFIMHLFFPTYILNNIFHYTYIGYSFRYVLQELIFFIIRERVLLGFYVLAIAFTLWKIKKIPLWKLSFNINKPLLTPHLSIFTFDAFALIFFVIFVVKLGGNDGAANALYLYDLVYPFIFLSILTKIKPQGLKDWQKLLLILPCLFIMVGYPRPLYHSFQRQEQYRIVVQKVEALIDPSKNILSCSDLTSMVLKKNMPLNDSGHSEYFSKDRIIETSKVLYGSKVVDSDTKYKALVAENIRNKKYDYVFISWLGNYSLPEDFASYYKLRATYDYPGLWNGGKIELWVPTEG